MKKTSLYLAVALFSLLGTAAAYHTTISHLIPVLSDRAAFGESFGALNAIFSGIALIGVVCALYFQQKQLEIQTRDNYENLSLMGAQLREMQRSIQLQYQPVLQVYPKKVHIEKPGVFWWRGTCLAASRYIVEFEIRNVSQVSAINVVVSVRLTTKTESSEESLKSVGSHFPVLGQNCTEVGDALLVPEKPFVMLFEALRDRDASRIPIVDAEILYRNLTGGCFLVKHAFYVLVGDMEESLGNWQQAIAGFSVMFQPSLRKFTDLENQPSLSNELFEDIKKRYASQLAGPEAIDLEVKPVPGAFFAENIPGPQYDEMIRATGFPRLTFADSKCLFSEEELRQGDAPS